MSGKRPFIVYWRKSLMEAAGVSGKAWAVGCVLAEFANGDGGSCYPSQKTIAEGAKFGSRSVQRALQELESGRWIARRTESRKAGAQGQAWRTTYRLTIPEEDATQTPSPHEEPAKVSPSSEKSTPHSQEEHVTVAQDIEQMTKNTYTVQFEEAYAAYPRKIGRKKAERAYIATRRRGVEAETVLRAVSRYAAVCQSKGTERDFIKHPSTFFGPDEPWQDFLEEPADPHADSLARSAAEVAAYRARAVSNE